MPIEGTITVISPFILFFVLLIIHICREVPRRRRTKKEEAAKRKSKFPQEVRSIIFEYMFPKSHRSEGLLAMGAINSTEKILASINREDLSNMEEDEILKTVRSMQPPMYVLRALTANINLIKELKKKWDERDKSIDTIFEKLFPSLDFEDFDKLNYLGKRTIIFSILQNMKVKGE